MDGFVQAAAGVLVAVIVLSALKRQAPEIATVLSVLVCAMVGFAAAGFLEPVVTFMRRLQRVGGLDEAYVKTLLKIVGICFIAEITELVCQDSGNTALGKVLQFTAAGFMLYLSLPMLTTLLELVEGILENL